MGSDCGHTRATRRLAEAMEWLCLDYQCQYPGVRYSSWENWVKGAQDFLHSFSQPHLNLQVPQPKSLF